MQLVIGGAYSGKRNFVNQNYQQLSVVSSYQNDRLDEVKDKWVPNTTLVLEGWEKWVSYEITNQENDDAIRRQFRAILEDLKEEELTRGDQISLIMLEVGKGIVPMSRDDRRLRDLLGWLAQDAVKMAEEVFYIWHGIERRMK